MAFDEGLATRVREQLAARIDIDERKMFGGLTFMLAGNMCCGVAKDELMVRVGVEREAEALGDRHARPCDFTGRPMTGLVTVSTEGFRTDANLQRWVEMAVAFASSLPPK